MDEQWKVERKALHAKHLALAVAIAKALGGTVETSSERDDIDDGRYQKVILEGRQIGLYFGGGRVEVSGSWPREQHTDGSTTFVNPKNIGAIKYDEALPTMGCSSEKSPEAIAKDIKRRFLPEFVRIYDACVERIKKNQEAGQAALKAARVLADKFGTLRDLKGNGQEATLWVESVGAVRVSCWNGRVSVRIERNLDGLSMSQAQRILAILAEKKAGE